jgi:hypothetical protein
MKFFNWYNLQMSNNRDGARHVWYRGKKQSKVKGEAQQPQKKMKSTETSTTETSTETQENENKTCEQEKEEMSEDDERDADKMEQELDFSRYFGNPSEHHRYSMLKNGYFSDFKLRWNGNEYSVHKCVLSVKCLYFEKLYKAEWKDVDAGDLQFPEGFQPSSVVWDAFLNFIYTSRILETDFKSFMFELYDLSTFYQVKSLKVLCLGGIRDALDKEPAEQILTRILSLHKISPRLKQILADHVASEYSDLTTVQFPFHKLGKNDFAQCF